MLAFLQLYQHKIYVTKYQFKMPNEISLPYIYAVQPLSKSMLDHFHCLRQATFSSSSDTSHPKLLHVLQS